MLYAVLVSRIHTIHIDFKKRYSNFFALVGLYAAVVEVYSIAIINNRKKILLLLSNFPSSSFAQFAVEC